MGDKLVADDFNLEMALDLARFAALLPMLFAASRSMLLNSSKLLLFARPVVFRRVHAVLLGAARFDDSVFRPVVDLGAARALRTVPVVLPVFLDLDRFAPTVVYSWNGTYSTR